MWFERFIATRVGFETKDKSTISAPIIKIALLSIIISIIVILISVGAGFGMQQEIRTRLSIYGGHLQIMSYENNNSYITQPIEAEQWFYPEFTSVEEVEQISMYGYAGGALRTQTDFEAAVLKGVSYDYQHQDFSKFITQGQFPAYKKSGYNDTVCISTTLASRLSLSLYDQVEMIFIPKQNKPAKIRKFVVGAVFQTSIKDFDENFVIGDLNHVRKINKWKRDQVGGFEVWIEQSADIDNVSRRIYNKVGYDFNVLTIAERNQYLTDWVNLFDLNIVVILFIMIVISLINVSTAILVLILERTRMISILKSMGATNLQIKKIFLINASQLLIRGLLIGNVVGLLLLWLQHEFHIISLDPKHYYVEYAPVSIDAVDVLAINLLMIAICVIGLLLPTHIITRIRPVRAMKV